MLKKIGYESYKRIVEGRFLQEVVRYAGLIVGLIIKFIMLIIKKIFFFIDFGIGIIGKYILAKTTSVEKDKIMFLTFQGDYTCNPKKIADEIIKQDLDYKLVWDVKTPYPTNSYPLELKFAKHNTYEFYKELASAKVIIENTNIIERLGVYKKKNQYLLQTWHGSLGIKKLDGDVVMGFRWKRIARKCRKYVDYCLSNSTFETEVFDSSYWKGVPSLLTGHARNDVFFYGEEEKRKMRKKVSKFLEIAEDKKIFLFAPTHRDNVDEFYQSLDYENIREALKERFGGEWHIVIRFHNRLRNGRETWMKRLSSHVSDATNYEDMQELLVSTEAGATDYSSWIFDFMLSYKPGFIVEQDTDTFEKQRGFYYPIETTPFSSANNSIELINNIRNFNDEKYQKDVEQFLKDKGCMEDGHASERIVEKIIELMET